ncbi:MAG: LCP family protein [Defluviitaleaceae bacterium]|nr:LCP family protein [Defluviitaleaceae bacterium]
MNKSLFKKYIAIVTCLIGSFAIIGLSAVMAHNFTLAGQTGPPATQIPINGNGGQANQATGQDNPPDEPEAQALDDLNILVLGLDDDNLPDVIMIVMYDGENHEIDVVSVPRDTQVVMTQTERDMMAEIGRRFPSHGVVKINELHAHAGRTNGYRLVSHHLENMLDIEIDYYVIIELDAFKYIVDAVGGIYVDVPPGFRYTVTGGAIRIDLPPGRQRLDGNMAEQFVRRRNTLHGDLDRIRNQQIFMREFFTQVLGSEDLMSRLPALASSFITHVRTDFGILSALRYVGMADALNLDSIEFHTLPGHAGTALNPVGREYSWFFVDVEGSRELIREIKADNAANQ